MAFHTVLETTKLRHLKLHEPLVVEGGSPLREVLAAMSTARCACACVVEGGKLRGLFTVRDVLNRVVGTPDVAEKSVQEVMTSDLVTLDYDATVDDAINEMSRGGYRHLPVLTEDGEFFTCVSAIQIMEFITEHFPRDVRNLPPHAGQEMTSPEGA